MDGLTVFESQKLDVLAGDDVAGGFALRAEGGVALVEAVVEVAVGGPVERWALAAEAVGLDVLAESELHWSKYLSWGYPPGGVVLKVQWLQ